MMILHEPHTCDIPSGRHYPRGTVWKCDDCGTQWVRNACHPDNAYPLWRRKLFRRRLS